MNSATPFTLYILRTGDDLFYTGITTNLKSRLSSHQMTSDFEPNSRQWTKFHQPVKLVFEYGGIENQAVAIKLERYVKSLKKEYKQLLVSGDAMSLDYLIKKHQFFRTQNLKPKVSGQIPISNRL
jgi:putative endonuclease